MQASAIHSTPTGPTSPAGSFANARRSRATAACTARCTASDVLRWAGMPEHASTETDSVYFSMRRLRADGVLAHEGQAFEHLYFVSAGSFKSVQTDVEGYEQVLGFAIRGDSVGLDGLYQGRYTSTAVALEDSMVAVMPFRELVAAGRRVSALEQLLHHAAGAELMHRSDTQYLMSAASSEVRVARFLLHLAQRQNAMGHSDRRFRLRMTRRDIASYLGVAHETVSRALTALQQGGYIAVSHRDIEITDGAGLHELQRLTRGNWRGGRDHASLPTDRVGTETAGMPLAA
jgi:CRP/FNR family transcriptional regulator, anaerobic regulatory protein